MSYATATQFHRRYGLEDAAQQLADEQQLLTGTLLLDAIAVATGGAWTGTPTADEQAAAVAALARLERELAVASSYMDGYLRSAMTLPLAPGDAAAGTLEDCCLALARCGLADDTDNATERMDKRCAEWRVWLKDIAAGRVQLVGGTGSTPVAAGGVRSGQAASGFDWGSFGAVQ